ncbi:hypothetical protein [Butyrivibrio fibrisolvens]|uniref:hypothetical protein n=1 Tax=Butyrivibrio fibrisolvens TaxID=831 RepID=UPI0004151519|nr:hypothetical protein [Butyrivibrio fibrisolvens]
MSHSRVKHIVFMLLIILISLVEVIYILFSPVPRKGLENLWMLPVTFCLSFFCGRKIFWQKRGMLGVKIYLFLATLRYLVQPVLIVLTNGNVSVNRMSVVDEKSYSVAILIECVELIIVTLAISVYYPICLKKLESKMINKEMIGNYYGGEGLRPLLGIKNLGWLVIGAYVLVLLARINIWLPALKLYGIKSDANQIVVLENTLFACVKTVLFVYCLYRALIISGENGRIGKWHIFTIISGLISCITYFGSNRSFTLETVVTIVVILMIWFPKYRAQIALSFIPLSAVMLLTMFITKQFGVNSSSDLTELSLGLQYISNQLEEYTNGPWCIAQSYAASKGLSFNDSFHALVKDIFEGLVVVFEIPGLKGLNGFAADWRSSTQIMKYAFESVDRGQMLSFSGGFFICFGTFGWIVFPIVTMLCTMAMVWFSVHGSYEKTIFKQYIYLWSSFLFGLMHCYCAQTLIYCMSRYVLFLWLIILGNKFIIGKKRR